MLLATNCIALSRLTGLNSSLQRSLSTSRKLFSDKEITRSSDEESCDTLDRNMNSLTLTVTPKLEKQIVGEAVGQKFILKQALNEIRIQERKRYPLPLPASLTVEQWKTLISFTDRRSRFFYLDSLMYGKKTLQEIRDYDEKFTKPLQVPQEMIDQVVGDNPEARKRIEMFLMYHELERQAGNEVPPEVKAKELREITEINSRNGIQKYIQFLNRRTNDEIKDMRHKSHSKPIRERGIQAKKDAIKENDHLFYGLGNNAINLRVSDLSMKRDLDWRVWREFSLRSSPLIVDFSYVSKMKNSHRVKSLIEKEGISPEIQRRIEKFYHIDEKGTNFPVEITEKLNTDLFPKERLVYLSPDSKNDLMQFDDDDIYVIGGIVDKGTDYSPLTLANAKRNKIRHARFPMRRTIGLAAELNVEACIAIMNDMKYSNDWFYSMRWVPSRFFFKRASQPGASQQHKLAYRARQALHPLSSGKEWVQSLSPSQYRHLYRKVIEAKSREETAQILEGLGKKS